MTNRRSHGRKQGGRFGAGAAALAGGIGLLLAATAGGDAGTGSLTIENRSEHPVKLALPGTPAAVIGPGAEPARVEAVVAQDATGVTARLWWTSDPRQLCQIYTPWERTITVTGSREIICRSR
jgi:hypothetical protein